MQVCGSTPLAAVDKADHFRGLLLACMLASNSCKYALVGIFILGLQPARSVITPAWAPSALIVPVLKHAARFFWNPLFLDPSDGVFGRFDLAALCDCHTLIVCYVMFAKATK